jgi:hypothetical protein
MNRLAETYLLAYLTKAIFTLVVGLFLLLLPFQVWQELFSATQTAKVLFLGWGVVGFVAIVGVYYLFTGKPWELTFTKTDLFVGVFLLYAIIHAVWIKPVQLHPLFVTQWLALAILYIAFRRFETRHQLILMIFVMIAAAAQAVYGNLQLYGIYPSYHNLFNLTGSFFNPGPYSGYLVSALPVAVGFYIKSSNVRVFKGSNVRVFEGLNVRLFERLNVRLFERLNVRMFGSFKREASNISNSEASNIQTHIWQSIFRLIAITTIISILLVLPAGRSRAAWLAVIISLLYLLSAAKGEATDLWYRLVGTDRRKWLLYTLITIFALAITSGLYLMKKGSADGRLLIWKVTIDAIKERPLLGQGIDKFKAFYMDGQAGYFKDYPDSPEAAVAGDNNYAFNEPLRIASYFVYPRPWGGFTKATCIGCDRKHDTGYAGQFLFCTVVLLLFEKEGKKMKGKNYTYEDQMAFKLQFW